MKRSGGVAILLCVFLVLAGCGGNKPASDGKSTDKGSGGTPEAKPENQAELMVYSGAGIRPPVAELAEAFGKANGIKVVTDYAGSEVLLSRLKLAKRGDVYLPGDKHYIEQAKAEGIIKSHRSICFFVPTILVRKGNPKGIKGLPDLVKPDVKLGLGNPKACAIGRKTKKIFQKNNIAWTDVEKNLKFPSMTVNELGMQIKAGKLDAVIVWDAIAKYYAEDGVEVPIPVEQNVISTVEAGVLSFSKDEKLAAKFVDFMASKEGLEVFKKHNYRVTAPGGEPKAGK